jgi:two-component system response regulator DevR
MKMTATQLKILIVDGSDLVLERLSGMVSEALCVSSPVLISNSYQKAVQILSSQRPDVLLLDIQLPGNRGLDLLELVSRLYPKLKTVVVTNNADNSYKERCVALGAFGFIDKSTEFEKIPSLIDSFGID